MLRRRVCSSDRCVSMSWRTRTRCGACHRRCAHCFCRALYVVWITSFESRHSALRIVSSSGSSVAVVSRAPRLVKRRINITVLRCRCACRARRSAVVPVLPLPIIQYHGQTPAAAAAAAAVATAPAVTDTTMCFIVDHYINTYCGNSRRGCLYLKLSP